MKASRFRFRACVLLLGVVTVAGCASSGGGTGGRAGISPYRGRLPSYIGPPAESGRYPDMTEHITVGNEYLAAAMEAMQRQNEREGWSYLGQGEQILENALRLDPHSRAAAVALGTNYFYQGYYGKKNGFSKAVAFLTRILEADPYADGAARFLAHAYLHAGDTKSAIYYADYVDQISRNPAFLAEMAELTQGVHAEFLNNWYEYSDYYESSEARILEYDPKTFQTDVVLQVTPEQERQWGEEGFRQITQGLVLSADEQTRGYVQGLVDRLTVRTPGPPITNRVDIVESEELNAMALPGRILVNTGLLRAVDNEAELVAVLAHELAHVYAHHGARKLVSDHVRKSTAGTLLSLVKVKDELKRELLNLGAEAVLHLIRQGYSRSQEKEADRYGTHIAYNAGYNPTYMTTFFVRLYEASPRQPFKLLSSHPPTPERIEYTVAYLDNFPLQTEMQLDSREFQEMKMRLGSRP